jgi:hypothetical protein
LFFDQTEQAGKDRSGEMVFVNLWKYKRQIVLPSAAEYGTIWRLSDR